VFGVEVAGGVGLGCWLGGTGGLGTGDEPADAVGRTVRLGIGVAQAARPAAEATTPS
jgi:hypothetical protein